MVPNKPKPGVVPSWNNQWERKEKARHILYFSDVSLFFFFKILDVRNFSRKWLLANLLQHLITVHRWDSYTSFTFVLTWLLQCWRATWVKPCLPTRLMGKPDNMCGVLLWAALQFSRWKKTPHVHETQVWAAWLNRKGGYIGYSMTRVSRSSSIWSFKSFCLKDLVSRGGLHRTPLQEPL